MSHQRCRPPPLQRGRMQRPRPDRARGVDGVRRRRCPPAPPRRARTTRRTRSAKRHSSAQCRVRTRISLTHLHPTPRIRRHLVRPWGRRARPHAPRVDSRCNWHTRSVNSAPPNALSLLLQQSSGDPVDALFLPAAPPHHRRLRRRRPSRRRCRWRPSHSWASRARSTCWRRAWRPRTTSVRC